MRFKVKTTDAEVLKKYGFKLPEEWLASGALDDANVNEYSMIDERFYIYQMDEEDPSKIATDDVDGGNPLIEGWIDIRNGSNTLWFDVTPCGTYHSSMEDLLTMMNVIYELTRDGLLERVEEDE